MPTLPLSRLQPQMTLAADVHDRNGRLLARKGMVLSNKHFLVFKTWGIKEVEVIDATQPAVTDPADVTAQIDPEQLHKAIEDLRPRFRLNDGEHPLIQELLRLAAQQQVLHHD